MVFFMGVELNIVFLYVNIRVFIFLFFNRYTMFCCCHANVIICCWEDRNPMHNVKDYQICLLRFVCLKFKYVSSDLFVQIRFFRFVFLALLSSNSFLHIQNSQISSYSDLFVHICQISDFSDLFVCFFKLVSSDLFFHFRLLRFVCSDSFVQVCLFRFDVFKICLFRCVSSRVFLQIRFFIFFCSDVLFQICLIICLFLWIRFFRFVSSDSFYQINLFVLIWLFRCVSSDSFVLIHLQVLVCLCGAWS